MKKSLFLCGALVLLFASCATTVPVQITKPAEVNMAAYKTLLVQDFRYPREYWYDDADKVARYASSKLVEELTATGYFKVINTSDVANWSNLSPVDLGTKTGANALVVPEILQFDRNSEYKVREYKVKDKNTGETVTKYEDYTLVTDTVDVSYRVVDTRTGSVYVTKTFEEKDVIEVTNSGNQTLVSKTENGQKLLAKIIQKISRQLAPYTVTEGRSLLSDKTKSEDMKAADALVKQGSYDLAYDRYLSIWKATKNPAAGGNAAILLEILGRLDEAIPLMESVYKDTGDKNVNLKLGELLQQKKDQDKLKAQMGA